MIVIRGDDRDVDAQSRTTLIDSDVSSFDRIDVEIYQLVIGARFHILYEYDHVAIILS